MTDGQQLTFHRRQGTFAHVSGRSAIQRTEPVRGCLVADGGRQRAFLRPRPALCVPALLRRGAGRLHRACRWRCDLGLHDGCCRPDGRDRCAPDGGSRRLGRQVAAVLAGLGGRLPGGRQTDSVGEAVSRNNRRLNPSCTLVNLRAGLKAARYRHGTGNLETFLAGTQTSIGPARRFGIRAAVRYACAGAIHSAVRPSAASRFQSSVQNPGEARRSSALRIGGTGVATCHSPSSIA